MFCFLLYHLVTNVGFPQSAGIRSRSANHAVCGPTTGKSPRSLNKAVNVSVVFLPNITRVAAPLFSGMNFPVRNRNANIFTMLPQSSFRSCEY